MDYDMKKPCDNCPFRRGTPMRLTKGRVKEIAGMMLSTTGGEFPCHKTTVPASDDDCERTDTKHSKHCAGALIFAEVHKTSTQMMRICERLRMYDYKALMANKAVVAEVFGSVQEMLKHHTRPD